MTPIEGWPIVRITPELSATASIKEIKPSSDSSQFFSTADLRAAGVDEIFVSGLPTSRVVPGADVDTQVNGGLKFVGGVEANFEQVITRSIFTAAYASGVVPLGLGSSLGQFHQWAIGTTGEVGGNSALTFRYAPAGTQATGANPTQTVYMKIAGGAWNAVDPALVSFQPGQFTDNLSRVEGVTIGAAISAIPEPATLLLGPLAAIGLLATRRRCVGSAKRRR